MSARAPLLAWLLCLAAGVPAALAGNLRIEHAALELSPDHYIVAGFDNVQQAPAARAGSSPRGYDGITRYGPSPQARRLLKEIEQQYHLREVSAWPIEPLHMHCAVLQIPDGADREALLAALSADPRIRLAQPLQTFETRTLGNDTQGYNDPYVGLQRGFSQMHVPDAHALSRGDGVRVAVVDTGADVHHPDLRGRIARIINVVDADDRQFSRDRHGTEVAGVIAAAANNHEGIVGVAPRAQLVLIKACWQLAADADPARCNSFTLAQGIVAALDAGANVVNLSLAGPADPLLHSLIAAGLRRGVLFVGAAPGAGPRDGFMRETGVLEVDNITSPLAGDARLYAPGNEVLTLMPGGRYDFASGSSIATAQVTGIVALLLARHSGLDTATVQQLLQRTSVKLASLAGSAGATQMVDACAALSSMTGEGECHATSPERMAGAH